MDSETQRAQVVARQDRIASEALDAEDRAVDAAWGMLDEARATLATYVAEGDTWADAARDSVRDFSRDIVWAAIAGETSRDDDARDALADWLREEAERIASEWIAARGVAT